MKKLFLSIVVLALLCNAVQAQSHVWISADTLPCGERQRDYYYSVWYDTVDFYLRPDGYSYSSPEFSGNFMNLEGFGGSSVPRVIEWKQQFASRRIRIKGLWAMVRQDGPASIYTLMDSMRLPEYLYIGLRDKDWPVPSYSTEKFLTCMDSVRWDTAQPKMMCVKQTADGRKGNRYCHVYEALFDTAYALTGEFWIGGSGNSNVRSDPNPLVRDHWPTVYMDYSAYGIPFANPNTPYNYECTSYGLDGLWFAYENRNTYGPFGVILDEPQFYVEVPSADTSRGIAKPTAYYPAGSRQTITAVANHCYRFSHWSDGDTSNPRSILVTQDTVFTAYFDTVSNIYAVSARSNDTTMGSAVLREWPICPVNLPPDTNPPNYDSFLFPLYRVIGSDTVYCEGDSAIFWARPKSGYYFWYWNDSVRENPRTIIVTQDTGLTAIFKREVPPEYVRPCPRIAKPRVVVMDTGEVLLTWAWGVSTLHEGGWEVAWGLAGLPPDSCAIIPCGNYDRILDGLEVGVRYVAYVRAVCSHNGTPYYSDWSDSVEIYFPYFPHRYTVTVAADYAERGRVYGGGEYDEGDMAMLTANAWSPYSFLQWDDGDTANPRYVVVTQDTSFTALFAEQDPLEGIATVDGLGSTFRLLPNPTSGSVVCVVDGETSEGGVLTVTDVAGREVLRKELPPLTADHTISLTEYPKGVYFVTFTTARGSTTQKLVVGE